jgi:hypothetical protein
MMSHQHSHISRKRHGNSTYEALLLHTPKECQKVASRRFLKKKSNAGQTVFLVPCDFFWGWRAFSFYDWSFGRAKKR